jgi:hypothetical protein
MFVECILESLEREKYVSNIYTWKICVWPYHLFLLLSSESATLEGQADGQMDWPFPHWLECELTPLEDLLLVTHTQIPVAN